MQRIFVAFVARNDNMMKLGKRRTRAIEMNVTLVVSAILLCVCLRIRVTWLSEIMGLYDSI